MYRSRINCCRTGPRPSIGTSQLLISRIASPELRSARAHKRISDSRACLAVFVRFILGLVDNISFSVCRNNRGEVLSHRILPYGAFRQFALPEFRELQIVGIRSH